MNLATKSKFLLLSSFSMLFSRLFNGGALIVVVIKAGLFHWAQYFVFSSHDYKSVLLSLTFLGLPHANRGRLSSKNWLRVSDFI